MSACSVTYSDIAVRLDFVDPEAILHQGARSAQQLLELAQSERPHLHKQIQVTYSSLLYTANDSMGSTKDVQTCTVQAQIRLMSTVTAVGGGCRMSPHGACRAHFGGRFGLITII